ncbi:MAG: metal ABC transporter permease [Rhodospirillales bacterium]
MDALIFLLPAFVLSALLIMTHVYLGLHVLARGIIFVDIALAQVAAFGASVAFLLGENVHGPSGQVFSFAFTLIAAFGFAQLRRIPDKTAREVIIGCVYVVTTALSIVVLSRSVAGMEELKTLFNGSMLWVRWGDIVLLAVLYGVIGIILGWAHGRFRRLSASADFAPPQAFVWECLFFACFAVVITSAVHLAGILVVFAFLIIPAFSASMLAVSWGARLIAGWVLGGAGSMAGLLLAYAADLPVGATVVAVLGILPVLTGIVRSFRKA